MIQINTTAEEKPQIQNAAKEVITFNLLRCAAQEAHHIQKHQTIHGEKPKKEKHTSIKQNNIEKKNRLCKIKANSLPAMCLLLYLKQT